MRTNIKAVPDPDYGNIDGAKFVYSWLHLLIEVWKTNPPTIINREFKFRDTEHYLDVPVTIECFPNPREQSASRILSTQSIGWGILGGFKVIFDDIFQPFAPEDVPDPTCQEKPDWHIPIMRIHLRDKVIGAIATVDDTIPDRGVKNKTTDLTTHTHDQARNGFSWLSMHDVLELIVKVVESLLKYRPEEHLETYFHQQHIIARAVNEETHYVVQVGLCEERLERPATFEILLTEIKEALLEPIRDHAWCTTLKMFEAYTIPGFGYIEWGLQRDLEGVQAGAKCKGRKAEGEATH